MTERPNRFSRRAGDKWLVPQIVLALILLGGLVIALLWLMQPVVGDDGSSGQEIGNEEHRGVRVGGRGAMSGDRPAARRHGAMVPRARSVGLQELCIRHGRRAAGAHALLRHQRESCLRGRASPGPGPSRPVRRQERLLLRDQCGSGRYIRARAAAEPARHSLLSRPRSRGQPALRRGRSGRFPLSAVLAAARSRPSRGRKVRARRWRGRIRSLSLFGGKRARGPARRCWSCPMSSNPNSAGG